LLINKINASFDEEFYKNAQQIDTTIQENYSVTYNDILDYVEEDKAILNFKGDFYCIINDRSYSASLSFASLNNYLSNFYTVGEASPCYGGFCSTPLMFMLPNTKLMFRLASNFDYKMYNENMFRVNTTIKVEKDLEEDIEYWDKRFLNYNSKRYLFKRNKYLKEILESTRTN
jgi:hypothetical protein